MPDQQVFSSRSLLSQFCISPSPPSLSLSLFKFARIKIYPLAARTRKRRMRLIRFKDTKEKVKNGKKQRDSFAKKLKLPVHLISSRLVFGSRLFISWLRFGSKTILINFFSPSFFRSIWVSLKKCSTWKSFRWIKTIHLILVSKYQGISFVR